MLQAGIDFTFLPKKKSAIRARLQYIRCLFRLLSVLSVS